MRFYELSLELIKVFFRRLGYLRFLRRPWFHLAAYFLCAVVVVLDLGLTNSRPTKKPSTPPVIDAIENVNSTNERIFVVSLHWNDEALIRDHWKPAILDLVQHFGADNIYVSVIEGGSWDGTKSALTLLDLELEKLGVERNIELRKTTHEDEVKKIPEPGEKGWIWTSGGGTELRRIPYLAKLRNQAMGKLREVTERTNGRRRFDKVLWLNDIIFTVEDVTTLLETRDGDYSAVCALDFSHPPLYYDSFALRDIEGDPSITMTWPYFLAPESRRAMMVNSPIPVKSCWNGMVIFQAESFYKEQPLTFRGLPDSVAEHHLEASECCLIHADNELSATKGVWLNPNVRVSYNQGAYEAVNPQTGMWPGRGRKLLGIWRNRWARWMGGLWRSRERRLVNMRIQAWREEANRGAEDQIEVGTHCIVNEMQILVHNGWQHLRHKREKV